MVLALTLVYSLIIGFMIFFMSVVTPSVFKTLDEKNSRNFLRFIFPRMFLYGFILSFVTLLLSIYIRDQFLVIISFSVSIFFLINTYIITPKINFHRDQFNDGIMESEKVFKRYHLISVVIFLIQLISSIGAIIVNNL
jgi:hypothetical protein